MIKTKRLKIQGSRDREQLERLLSEREEKKSQIQQLNKRLKILSDEVVNIISPRLIRTFKICSLETIYDLKFYYLKYSTFENIYGIGKQMNNKLIDLLKRFREKEPGNYYLSKAEYDLLIIDKRKLEKELILIETEASNITEKLEFFRFSDGKLRSFKSKKIHTILDLIWYYQEKNNFLEIPGIGTKINLEMVEFIQYYI